MSFTTAQAGPGGSSVTNAKHGRRQLAAVRLVFGAPAARLPARAPAAVAAPAGISRAPRAGPRIRRAAAAARSFASPRSRHAARARCSRRSTRPAAHRRVRSRRRHRPGRAELQDREPFLTIAGPDRALARHHADPRRHRHRHARRDRAAHPHPPRRGRRAEAQRPDFDAISTVGGATTSSSITARSPGPPTRTCRLPARASPATRRTNGARAPRTASPSATTSSPRAWPIPRTPRASIPRAR